MRDPRTDPQPHDLLRMDGDLYVVLSADPGRYVESLGPDMGGVDGGYRATSLSLWRAAMQTAQVLRVARGKAVRS